MERRFVCSKEVTLSQQVADDEKYLISKILIEGRLCGSDLMLLSDMSKHGSLRQLDMHGVTELDTDDLEEDGSMDCYPFYDNDRIEEVCLPNVSSIDYPMFYYCKNLKCIEIPDTVKQFCDVFLFHCPNVEEIYVPGDLRIDYDGRYQSDNCFVGSGKLFISDFDGWPEKEEDTPDSFFTYDGVLYENDVCGISLHRYPAGDERTGFTIPEGVTNIEENAFNGNPYLKKIIIPKSVRNIEEDSIVGCSNLETLIFMNDKFGMFSCKDAMYAYSINPSGLNGSPRLKDVYLYADDPNEFEFGIFEGLENIGDITLHVPCFCAAKYRNQEVEFCKFPNSQDKRKVKVWRRFKNIEEFDPIDFLEELNER